MIVSRTSLPAFPFVSIVSVVRTHEIGIDLKLPSYCGSRYVKIRVRCSLHHADPANQSHEELPRCEFRQLRTLHLPAAAVDRLLRDRIGRYRWTVFHLRSASQRFRKILDRHFSRKKTEKEGEERDMRPLMNRETYLRCYRLSAWKKTRVLARTSVTRVCIYCMFRYI